MRLEPVCGLSTRAPFEYIERSSTVSRAEAGETHGQVDGAAVAVRAGAASRRAGRCRACRLAACQAGIRYANRTDLMMAVLDPGTTAAGVLTRSKTCSAPVLWCRENLEKGKARALVVNSGNANAFTGKKGAEATRMTAEAAAAAVGCAPDEVYVSSTGVIGEPLDASKFAHLLAGLAEGRSAGRLARGRQGDHDHRHVSQARHAHGEARRRRRGHQRLRQGRRHDRARPGDDAGLHLHGRGRRPGGAAGDAGGRRRQDLQLHHHRQRYLDQRHRAAVCDRRRRRARRASRSTDASSAGWTGVRRRAARPDARAGAVGGQGRRGPDQADHRST